MDPLSEAADQRRPDEEDAAAALEGVEDEPTVAEYLDLLTGGGTVDPDLVRAAADASDTGDAERALTVRFRLTRDLRKRLDKYLQDRIPFMSRTQLQRLVKEEAVTVNGRAPKSSTILRLDDEIVVVVPPPPAKEIPAEEIPLSVLHEDDDLIVVNKQADLIVHPARSHKSGTLINALAWRFQHQSGGRLSGVGGEQARPGVIHRLDRNTTGAIVVAKSDTAHWRLARQFSKRTVDKRYLALVLGRVEPPMDVIDLPIGKHPRIREMMAVRYDASAKESVTVYCLREQFEDCALLELELQTGRTHQIRVHLAHLGWPILGDDMYGGEHGLPARSHDLEGHAPPASSSESPLIARQALHATSLTFEHPTTREPMRFLAPLWPDMRRLLLHLREHQRAGGPIAPPGSTLDVESIIALGAASFT